MIQVIYNGVDVTDDVSINQCYHDMYAEGQSDTLYIRFNDTANLWDRWSPQVGDTINVVYGSIRTGLMFVSKAVPQNGLFSLHAMSAPRSAFVRRYKAWRSVKLSQILAEIARRNGLTLDIQGVDDYLYSYILQDNEGDFPFLHKRCTLEGCAFLVYDGKLIAYKQSDMEAQAPLEVITLSADGDFRFTDNSAMLYGSCRVECGDYAGEYIADSINENVYIPPFAVNVTSNAEASRFSRGLLREANKNAYTGYIRGQIAPQYAASSVVQIENERAPSWNGSAFFTHVRNDYSEGTSKMFFRKPLGGY